MKEERKAPRLGGILTSRTLTMKKKERKKKDGKRGGTSSCRNSGRGHSAAVILPPMRPRYHSAHDIKRTGIEGVFIIPTTSFEQSSLQEVLSLIQSSRVQDNKFWSFYLFGPSRWTFRLDSLKFLRLQFDIEFKLRPKAAEEHFLPLRPCKVSWIHNNPC